MLLIFAYINKYKNFIQQAIPFNNDYDVELANGYLSISYHGANLIKRQIYGQTKVEDIQMLVGKTGSGKTNLLQLLGRKEEERNGLYGTGSFRDEEYERGEYFFLYAVDSDTYFIECKNIDLPQFKSVTNPIKEKHHSSIEQLRKELEELYAQKIKSDSNNNGGKKEKAKNNYNKDDTKRHLVDRIAGLRRYLDSKENKGFLTWTAFFKVNSNQNIQICSGMSHENTAIINCYDKHAFLKQPYSDEREDGYRTLDWIVRMNAPFQRASLWHVCDYIREYTKSVEPGELKKQVSLVITNENFSDEIDFPLSANLMEKKFYRFSDRAKREGFVKKISERDMFIHDLWVDYCIYLRKYIEKLSKFPEEDEDEYDVYQEGIDYLTDKENFPFPEAADIPDYEALPIPKMCERLAKYIDRKLDGVPQGLLWHIWTDIRDIADFLHKLDNKYFSLTEFSMPVEDMILPENKDIIADLFGRMEQYRPDDIGLFSDYLLPYEFTYLSSGEYQYAKVFGIINDYISAAVWREEARDYIIFLDEPEIYMHPELVRKFISKLVEVCNQAKNPGRFQFIISTHSPLMLSDVTSDSIIRLNIDKDSGYCRVMTGTEKNYFGANIHSILADGFFLEYTIGEYARKYLQEIYDKLIYYWKQKTQLTPGDWVQIDYYKLVVDQIGDDLIKNGYIIILEQLEERRMK